MQGANGAAKRAQVQDRYEAWWASTRDDPKVAKPPIPAGAAARQWAWDRAWARILAQLAQLDQVAHGHAPEPLQLDPNLLFDGFLAAMAAGD